MCCCIPSDPIEDKKGKRKTFQNSPNFFQVEMLNSWYVDCPSSCGWCLCQAIPLSAPCTQYSLRYKLLEGDMNKYQCFQGIWDPICCCIHPGQMGEKDCPGLCLFCEALWCNSLAVSATRIVTMEKYQLRSDPCDYRLIWCSNLINCLSCICDVLAIIDDSFQQCANILDIIAEIVYFAVSGCMTAQVAHELNYQHNTNKQALVNNEIYQGNSNPQHEQSYHHKNSEQARSTTVVVIENGQQQQQQQHNVANI